MALADPTFSEWGLTRSALLRVVIYLPLNGGSSFSSSIDSGMASGFSARSLSI